MIVLEDLTSLSSRGPVLASVNAILPSDRRMALLGPSDRDKAHFIALLAGVVLPNKGRVVRQARVSFPVGQLPGFSRDLSVRVNVAHVARLYGADVWRTIRAVEKAFGSVTSLDRPYDKWPRDLRKPLSQIITFALPFDTYLFTDESQFPAATKKSGGTGEQTRFNAICELLVHKRIRTSGVIIPTNNLALAREHCDMAIYLDRGRLEVLDGIPRRGDRPARPVRRRHRLVGEH